MNRGVKAVEIQAVWHSAKLFTRAAAAEWCKEHNFLSDVYREKLDDDGQLTHHIHRQFDPKDPRIQDDSWAVLSDEFPEGVSVTTAVRKEQNAMDKLKKTGIQSEANPFEFVMSDQSVDRVGDVIEAKGWILDPFAKNPVALFGHNHDKPIGTWENVRIVGQKLIGRLKLAAEGTSAEIDTIRKLVEQRVLRAVSVGFQPLEAEPIKKTGGMRFTKQILHETSLVAVPANANALAIAKSLGANPKLIFASTESKGHTNAPVEGHGTGTTKGTATAHAERPESRKQSQQSNTGRKCMNIAERIAAKEQRLVAIKDDLTELKGLMADEEYELSDEDQETIETLTDEETSIIKSIDSLKKLEAGLAAKAQPVSAFAKRGIAPGAPAQAKKKGGSLFAKHVTAALFAKEHQVPLRDTIEQLYGNDDEVKATIGLTIEKSGIPAADTTTSGWAAELVQHDTEAFLEDLQPISIYAALRARGTGMNFNGMGSLKIPSRAASASPNNEMAGAWVGEGGVIPVKRGQITSQTLNPYKLAVISAWTNELDARAVPAIEAMVRKMILDDTAKTLDGYLFDAVGQVNGVRPAGLMNNVTLTAATAGSTAAGIITDLKVLFGKMAAAGVGANPVIVCNSLRLLGLSTITTAAGGFMFRDEVAAGRLLGVPVIAAEHFPANTVAIVDANSFVGANDTPIVCCFRSSHAHYGQR